MLMVLPTYRIEATWQSGPVVILWCSSDELNHVRRCLDFSLVQRTVVELMPDKGGRPVGAPVGPQSEAGTTPGPTLGQIGLPPWAASSGRST